jgi:hypothetical protein
MDNGNQGLQVAALAVGQIGIDGPRQQQGAEESKDKGSVSLGVSQK